jgi:hypothetical protein
MLLDLCGDFTKFIWVKSLFPLTVALLYVHFSVFCSVCPFLEFERILYFVSFFSVTLVKSWFQECSQHVILLFFVLVVSEAASTVDSLLHPILFLYQFYLHCVAANKSQFFFCGSVRWGWGWVSGRKWPIVLVTSERSCGGMRFGKGNGNTRREPAPQNAYELTEIESKQPQHRFLVRDGVLHFSMC